MVFARPKKNNICLFLLCLQSKQQDMKYIFILPLALVLSSCGGWSKGGENAFKDSCQQAGSIDCDCAMKLTKKKYPNESDFNEKGGDDAELALEIATKCYLSE